jgi:hypothetical protein
VINFADFYRNKNVRKVELASFSHSIRRRRLVPVGVEQVLGPVPGRPHFHLDPQVASQRHQDGHQVGLAVRDHCYDVTIFCQKMEEKIALMSQITVMRKMVITSPKTLIET